MNGSTRNILWLASSVLHKWEHMNALGEVHSEAPDCLHPGGRRARLTVGRAWLVSVCDARANLETLSDGRRGARTPHTKNVGVLPTP